LIFKAFHGDIYLVVARGYNKISENDLKLAQRASQISLAGPKTASKNMVSPKLQ